MQNKVVKLLKDCRYIFSLVANTNCSDSYFLVTKTKDAILFSFLDLYGIVFRVSVEIFQDKDVIYFSE